MRKFLQQYTIFLLLLVVLLPAPSRRAGAQSLAQDIEQLILDYQKLDRMKQMLSDMVTAYGEIKQGYEEVKGIAAGNFNLHKAFLDALLAISPVVRDYVKVGRIVNNETQLVKEYQAAKGLVAGSGRFSAAELDYFDTVYGNLLNGSLRNVDELAMVLSAGELRMSDAERLSAIDRIDRNMTGRLTFLRGFNSRVSIMAAQRGLERNDANVLMGLYGTVPH